MEIFVYLHSNDVSVEGRRNNYRFPFIISIKLNGCDDRNLTDMREKKNYGRNSFRWCLSTTFSPRNKISVMIMTKENVQRQESSLVTMDISVITEKSDGARSEDVKC